MINKIISAISEALYLEFGDAYDIYTESIEQGLQEPCFSIVCLNPSTEQFFGKRYFKQNQFCIHYFPFTENKNKECFDVLDRLMDCLEYTNLQGNVTRGSKMKGEVADGVLNFFMNFDMFVYKVQDDEIFMGTHKVITDVKG